MKNYLSFEQWSLISCGKLWQKILSKPKQLVAKLPIQKLGKPNRIKRYRIIRNWRLRFLMILNAIKTYYIRKMVSLYKTGGILTACFWIPKLTRRTDSRSSVFKGGPRLNLFSDHWWILLRGHLSLIW